MINLLLIMSPFWRGSRMTSFILESIILKNGGPLLFTVTSIASLSVQEKSSNFHFAYLYFKYNILHRTHYFQSFPLFFPNLLCFSFYTRHPLERYKPSVVYKTPLSYCFKVLYLLMFSYLFPADINTYAAKSNL